MYYTDDIANSYLYDNSVKVDCLSTQIKNQMYLSQNMALNTSFLDESSTIMRGFIDTTNEHKLKTDTYDNKYRCYEKVSDHGCDYPDYIGYECNTGMLYKLDEFNTYHNYPVCKIRDEQQEITCCPENIQIFDNITRRNIELPSHDEDRDLIIQESHIPQLQYNRCQLYK
tara:strand:- start:264 stop:773 length:510 start_codon:yes stop_codon:yes gene_type:complete